MPVFIKPAYSFYQPSKMYIFKQELAITHELFEKKNSKQTQQLLVFSLKYLHDLSPSLHTIMVC